MNRPDTEPKRRINSAWLDASHVVLIAAPGFPSFEEQIENDQRAQEQVLAWQRSLITESHVA